MAGRALAFSDPEIVRMATEDFVSVACDDWYQRRRQDAEGRFFRQVAEQGPRRGPGETCQGIYMLTADGRLLAYKNAGQAPEVMRDALRDALRKWNDLPESRRAPGAVKVEAPGPLDGGYTRKPPENGLVVNVYARALDDAAGDGKLADAACKTGDGDEASRDHLWLTEAEWRAMLPADPASAKPGDRFLLPPAIARRVARFHLIDNTRGEPPLWRRQDVRASKLELVVERQTPDRTDLRLEGSALLANNVNPLSADRGYDARLLGFVGYDRAKDRIDRFDVVAVGDHWGEGRFTLGARPGRKPLGVAFELAKGDAPGDAVPPQAAREVGEYFGTGKE